ncbi:DUF4382 domain-containing protein [Fervidobacterium gondwanense]|uniref:DUF4382 domain-containing protein n=1 Tax=Fervidobacterium gondwanense DSM 13020 TaxID=1121883 RepID=A0A1M7SAG9_FERGO|nr:DUF4382 domain-containing protein [Fervidobacterium gondwanense]SHN55559.1 protein of unknown function [Fervidobacterium gondwanense DSM 13020]
MKRLIFVFGIVLTMLVLFSCNPLNLFEPRTSKVSVVLSSGIEESGDTVKPQKFSGVEILGTQSRQEAPWVKNIEHLYVKVSKFSYRYSTNPGENKWATPTAVDKVVDLTMLDATELSWLTFDVPKGSVILALGFEITEATVTVNDTDYPVEIPAERKRIVLKNLNWQVVNDESQIVLSIDWTRSIVKASGGDYMLVPRIAYRWRGTLKQLWAIYGDVKINDSTPTEPLLIGLYEGTDTSATPVVLKMIPTRNEGKFYLGKHEKGTYTAVVWYIDFTYEGTDVTFTVNEATSTTFEHGDDTAYTELHLTIKK